MLRNQELHGSPQVSSSLQAGCGLLAPTKLPVAVGGAREFSRSASE